MPVSHHALIARMGSLPGARAEFARFVAAVVELADRVRIVREDPGDWGIDAFVGRLTDGSEVSVWQSKFFIHKVGASQQRQIRESFDAVLNAAAAQGYRVRQWTLVVPIDLSGPETTWWDRWKERKQALHSVEIALWDKHRLDTLLRAAGGPAVEAAFFPPFAAPSLVETLAELTETVASIQLAQKPLIRFIDWAPSLIRQAIKDLGDDPHTYARLDEEIGDPPDRDRVAALVMHPPPWLMREDARPWRLLGMLAEKFGEWEAARRAWIAAADQSEGDTQAGFLVAASIAADVAGDAVASAELLEAAELISPAHPRVLLQRVDQRWLGPERLRALEGLHSDEPEVAVLLAVHRATAYMLLSDMDAADRYVAEARRLVPDSLAVKATAVNAAIHRGRIASNEHRAVDYPALLRAHDDALEIRKELMEARRYEESLRLLMLAVDALTVVREKRRARALVLTASGEELASEDGAEVLGDAALRARGWREALSLTEHAHKTEGVQRIRASAHVEMGGLHEQNRALLTLDGLITARGREAPQAALFRLAATFGRRRAEWSEDAFEALREGASNQLRSSQRPISSRGDKEITRQRRRSWLLAWSHGPTRRDCGLLF
jgi:hypothetical protein